MQKIKLYDSPLLKVLFIVLALVIAVTIFLFSAEPATDSAERSTSLAKSLLLLVYPDFASLPAGKQEQLLSATDHLLRKTTHFCVYAALGIFICLVSLGCFATCKAHLLRTLLIGAAYAASDEIHQAFVPGRGPGVGDVLIDSAGVIAGALCALLLAKILLKRKKRY